MARSTLTIILFLAVANAASADLEVDRIILESPILGETRPLNVVIPIGYDPTEAYPVIFLLDGDTRDIARAAGRMQEAEPRVLVVGVENTDRTRDMFPEPMEAKGGRGGGAEDFLRFLVTELGPFIEGRYATDGTRVLCGQSNSGFFVLWAMTREPDAFDGWIAISPMIGWDHDLIHGGVHQLFEGRDSFPKILYMNQGGREHYRQASDFMPGFMALLEETAPVDFVWTNEFIADAGHIPPGSHHDGVAFVFSRMRSEVAEPGPGN